MSNRDHDFLTRTASKKRSNRNQGRKKLDRLLNVLIAIVAVLILINFYFIFTSNDEKAQNKNETETNQSSDQVAKNNDQNEPIESSTSGQDSSKDLGEDSNNESTNSNENSSESNNGTSAHPNDSQETNSTNTESVITQNSDDPIVEQVIINPNWEVTPTKQSGEHRSTYEKGHIDYEEKLLTIRNAVGLSEDNIIYWSVKNNGSSENSIAVVSSMDKQQKYRVSIEWVANQGWKPVKMEILKEIEGAY
ncbi:YrrS family protein [Ureibacillus acetophenoni]|uniref:Uncharacterized protein DUF1510 n=1 Tax=Ureibacillus acetophenoni TaxID=614649 RepID=A0A285U743_9BACL|nr:YrrS family protein [Ureibacillus acetophenoni]SOC36366.1 uncharacterized protein DUF1510 [Ureibacillus acetophenoni]